MYYYYYYYRNFKWIFLFSKRFTDTNARILNQTLDGEIIITGTRADNMEIAIIIMIILRQKRHRRSCCS